MAVTSLPAPSEELLEARAALDFWEHYNDHAGFIEEAGGQAAYDAELQKRFNLFYALNTNPS